MAAVKPLFSLGRIVATPGALRALESAQVRPASLLVRHVTGDWGDMDGHDKATNREALVYGNRVFSAYTLPDGEKVWVITEADRASTTLLLHDEY